MGDMGDVLNSIWVWDGFSWLARDYSFTLPRKGNPQPSTELCFFLS